MDDEMLKVLEKVTADQLKRVEAIRPPPDDKVKIVKLRRNIDAFFWLCKPCTKARLKKGWELVETRPLPASQECQDCRFKRGRL